jgi:hypothetical protein
MQVNLQMYNHNFAYIKIFNSFTFEYEHCLSFRTLLHCNEITNLQIAVAGGPETMSKLYV